jgi:nucleoside-diphosphate-sugar epimerase
MPPAVPHLLITGATGFLGGAIAAELAEDPHWEPLWPHVRFLVRATSKAEGCARMREVLKRFEVSEARQARIHEEHIILGDFLAPQAIFADPALASITHVINSGAVASFANHPQLWSINVEGTFAFAKELSEVARLERFVQVGTAMSIGPDAPNPVPEDYQSPTPIRHLVPYSETKIEIERRLRESLPELPLVVARPTIVVGHTRLGTRPSGSIYWVFRTAQLLERFTVGPDDRIDVVPVDWVAHALLMLATKPTLKHRFYHLSAGPVHSSVFAELDVAMARGRGTEPVVQRYRQASLDELGAMRGEYQTRLGPCHPRIMERAIRLYGQFAALNMTFHNEHLVEEGLAPPPPFAAYAEVCARTSEGITIADQMLSDFK